MKTCIIYECNSGLGKQIAIQLAKNNFHVVLASCEFERNTIVVTEIRKLSNSTAVEWMYLDLSSLESIHSFAEAYIEKFRYLNLIIYFEYKAKDQLSVSKNTKKSHNFNIVKLNGLLHNLLKNCGSGNEYNILSKVFADENNRQIESIAYSYDKSAADELIKFSAYKFVLK